MAVVTVGLICGDYKQEVFVLFPPPAGVVKRRLCERNGDQAGLKATMDLSVMN